MYFGQIVYKDDLLSVRQADPKPLLAQLLPGFQLAVAEGLRFDLQHDGPDIAQRIGHIPAVKAALGRVQQHDEGRRQNGQLYCQMRYF